jgi:hypothetical protein
MGEMKCIFNIGKNISILATVTQVSDVAHGPLVFKNLLLQNQQAKFNSTFILG